MNFCLEFKLKDHFRLNVNSFLLSLQRNEYFYQSEFLIKKNQSRKFFEKIRYARKISKFSFNCYHENIIDGLKNF